MSKMATREAYGKALVKLGQINDNVVVLDADLSKSTKTHDFYKSFPDRFFNMGIAEQNLIGAACGLSTAGKYLLQALLLCLLREGLLRL
ncbi:transketolase, pyrimidine binding domain protein [Clostridioides difficile CD39]|nr:transketolase, pyrimidine binding domain protein [Clostridioides difficile CD39]